MLGLHGPRDDMRATLPNLMTIMDMTSTAATDKPSKMKSASASTSSRASNAIDVCDSQTNLASVSNSSIDLNVPVPTQRPIQRRNFSFSDGELHANEIRYNEFMYVF